MGQQVSTNKQRYLVISTTFFTRTDLLFVTYFTFPYFSFVSLKYVLGQHREAYKSKITITWKSAVSISFPPAKFSGLKDPYSKSKIMATLNNSVAKNK